jgi:hypothetical protein
LQGARERAAEQRHLAPFVALQSLQREGTS